MIVVFLNNKLITADTAIPLMMEARSRFPDRPIRFYCFDRKTLEALRLNIVLWDSLVSLGSICCIPVSNDNAFAALVWRVRVVWLLIRLLILSVLRPVCFVHFKALNTGPFALLARFFPERTIFVESNGWGYDPLMMDKVAHIGKSRSRHKAPGLGRTVVGFSPHWPEFRLDNAMARSEVLLPPAHLSPAWQAHVRKTADEYIDADLARAGLPTGSRIIVFMLGYFGANAFLRNPDTSLRLFERTVRILDEEAGQIPVFIKPHIISDISKVKAVVKKAKRARIVVSHLHPAVLAMRAKAFVANYYSTTLPDAFLAGVPTIEFTDYGAETLKVTRGQSMRQEYVTHFINADEQKFRVKLRTLLNSQDKIAASPLRTGSFQPFVASLS